MKVDSGMLAWYCEVSLLGKAITIGYALVGALSTVAAATGAYPWAWKYAAVAFLCLGVCLMIGRKEVAERRLREIEVEGVDP